MNVAALSKVAAPGYATPRYQSGFGNHFATEALPGALPEGGTSSPSGDGNLL